MDAIFASIKRVRKDPDNVVHSHLVKLAKDKKRITTFAESWYAKHSRKRLVSNRQIAYRRCLNRRILSAAPPALLLKEDASEHCCMPVFGPWKLDEQLLQQAREDGRLTEWEVDVYKTTTLSLPSLRNSLRLNEKLSR